MKKLFPLPVFNASQECSEFLSRHIKFEWLEGRTEEIWLSGCSQTTLDQMVASISAPSYHRMWWLSIMSLIVLCVMFWTNAFAYGELVSPWLAVLSMALLGTSAVMGMMVLEGPRAPKWYQKLYQKFTKRPLEQAQQAVVEQRWDDPALEVFFDHPQRLAILSKEEVVEHHHRFYTSFNDAHPCRKAWQLRMKSSKPLRQQDIMVMETMLKLYDQEQGAANAQVVEQNIEQEASLEQQQLDMLRKKKLLLNLPTNQPFSPWKRRSMMPLPARHMNHKQL